MALSATSATGPTSFTSSTNAIDATGTTGAPSATTAPTATTRAQRAHAVGLLDAALADAALARNPGARDVALVDLHVGFVQATGDGVLSAQGQATGGGRSVCFCEAELRNADGALVARAMGTLRYLA